MAHLLIADDNKVMRKSLKSAFENIGHKVKTCKNGLEAIQAIKNDNYDCVITDYRMPEADGMAVLLSAKESSPLTPVIIITAFGDIEKAVEAMRCGAKDYITKPFAQNEIFYRLAKVLEETKQQIEITERDKFLSVDDFIGECPEIKRIKQIIDSVKDVDSSVLITGETGTGKNLIARIIHDSGPRARVIKSLPKEG